MEPTTQPAKAIIALQRRTNRSIAADLGYCEATVSRVLNGIEPPSERFRTGLSALLGLPEQVLFRPSETQVSDAVEAS
jgi:transcriptional regulator with XRE-family HTH domain